MKNFIIILFASVVLFSCEDPFVLDSEQADPKIVIEGLVTNHPGYQSVKISRSTDFYSSGATPRVTDAVVTVSDDLGNLYSFVHNPNGVEDSAGIYIPQTPFVGSIGRTYTLRVQADGELYEAEDELYPVTTMDSLSYQINAEEEEDPEVEGRFYEALMFTKEPQDETNYYLFKFYRNDSLTFDSDTDIYFSDDQFLAENINGIGTPIFYSLHDVARVEMYSISRFGYVFFSDLNTLINNDGGMFGPIPATPRTNLSNGALGFFQVSAVDVGEITIEE